MADYSTIAQFRTKSGLVCTDVSDANACCFIAQADAEITATTNQCYGSCSSIVEYKTVYLPKRADDVGPNAILLDHYPVQAISCFQLIDSSACVYATLCGLSAACVSGGVYVTCDYFMNPCNGMIELTSRCLDYVPKRAKITYLYGYSSVPIIVQDLSSTLASMKAWVGFLGGNYDRVNSYTLPEQSYNKGDFYDRGLKVVDSLKANAEALFNQLGKKQRSQMAITSGGYF